MDDFSERILEPTQRRLRDARDQGHVARSPDLAAALALAGAVALVSVTAAPSMERLAILIRASVSAAGGSAGELTHDAVEWTRAALFAGGAIVLPLLIAAWIVACAAHLSQVGWLFAPSALAPRLSRINPLNGLQRISSMAALFKSGFDAIKVVFCAAVTATVVFTKLDYVILLSQLEVGPAAVVASGIFLELACWLCGVLAALGVVEYCWQRWRQRHDLRMTPVEAREELRQSEGDPSTRRRRRSLAGRLTGAHIFSEAANAQFLLCDGRDLVLAIRYEPASMRAPIIAARGRGSNAFHMRKRAHERHIPVVNRAAIAQSLDRAVTVGREVPREFFQPLAEILATLEHFRGAAVRKNARIATPFSATNST